MAVPFGANQYILKASKDELLSYRGICLVSGDGLIFEVINALQERLNKAQDNPALLATEREINAIPLFHIPSGSSNATASSSAFQSGYGPYRMRLICSSLSTIKDLLLSALSVLTAPLKCDADQASGDEICWRLESRPIDAILVQSAGETTPHIGILSLTWGLIADIDIGFEFLRCLGGTRNVIGAVLSIIRWFFSLQNLCNGN
ncbi:hypothetical protein Ciccas_003510 [Cichlidogyrus casuarinus]|uniref:DAGKc domain-containing protein n=1 Tax=Cichlidogyrus casuarinus TaxID=1844966 RepID=A0ABD2QGF8_9PLAT